MKPIELLEITQRPDKNSQGIYIIFCIKNGKGYIGHTKQPFQRRFRQHRQKLNSKTHRNPHLQSAWLKYGKDEFLFLPIFEIFKHDVEEFSKRESVFIRQLDKDLIFNIDLNPISREVSSETREKMSKARKGRFVGIKSPLYGKKKTDEHKANLSKAHLGYKFTEERKIEYKNRFSGEGNPRHGVKISEETKQKIREKAIGRKHPEEIKKRISESVKEAKRKLSS